MSLPEIDYVSEMGLSLEALVLHHGETGTRITAGERRLFFTGLPPVELARAVNLGMNEAVTLFARRLGQASVNLSEELLRDLSFYAVMSILYDRCARKQGLGLREADLDSSTTREELIAHCKRVFEADPLPIAAALIGMTRDELERWDSPSRKFSENM